MFESNQVLTVLDAAQGYGLSTDATTVLATGTNPIDAAILPHRSSQSALDLTNSVDLVSSLEASFNLTQTNSVVTEVASSGLQTVAPTTQTTPEFGFVLDPLTGALVKSTTVTETNDWFSQTFADQRARNALRRYYADDNKLGRNDMITLFRVMSADNVIKGEEISDGQKVLQNSRLLGIEDHVRVLSDKVLGQNVASQMFQGQALGDLRVGSTGDHMEKLVNKWFLGGDRPMTVMPADSLGPEREIRYGWATGELFGTDNKIDLTDIRQGNVGDCYFLAAVGSLVVQDQSQIRDLFIDNQDGTYTVRFYGQKDGTVTTQADYVTVDRTLAINGRSGNQWDSRITAYHDNREVGTWVALLEKAFVQFSQQGFVQHPKGVNEPSGRYVANSYASIEDGNGFQTLPILTGTSAGYFSKDNNPGSQPNAGRWGDVLNLQQIDQALNTGWAVTIGTKEFPNEINPRTGIISYHDYVVVSTNVSAGTLTLYNPWGDTNAQINGTPTGDVKGYKTISYNDLLPDTWLVNVG